MNNKKYTLILIILLLIVGTVFLWAREKYFEKEFYKNSKVNLKIIEQNITKDTQFKNIEGMYRNPLFCNDKINLVFTDDQREKLYVKQGNSDKIELILERKGVGDTYGWSKDCKEIFFKEKSDNYEITIKSIDVKTKEIKEYPDFESHIELRALSITDTIYFLDNKTFQIKAKNNEKEWNISEDGGYYKILVSPNNKFIVAHKGAFTYLFNTEGGFIRELGNVIINDWYEDSKKLIGFLDETTDGHTISGSELYIVSIDGNDPIKITNTSNANEMYPVFKNEYEVIYSDDVNNGIFSISIKEFMK